MIDLYLTRLTLPTDSCKRRSTASDCAHRLLSHALAEQGIDLSLYPLCRTAEGKPYLRDSQAEISISHSGEWAVCAISDAPVGVDLEAIRPISAGVWRKFLAIAPHEPCGDAYEAILRWTRYEAALKRLGYVSPLPGGVEYTTLRLIPGYLLTVCGAEMEISVRFVSAQLIGV